MLDIDTIRENVTLQWVIAFAIATIASLALKAVLHFIAERMEKIVPKFKGLLDDMIYDGLKSTRRWVIFFWFFYPLSQNINANQTLRTAIFSMFVIATSIQIAIWGIHGINIWQDNVLKRKVAEDRGSISAITLFSTALQGFLIIALILMALSNLGINVGALLAGLGVGGVAVALAAQNILGDLFASLSIVLDKPFIVGDFIVAGNDAGTVEKIGIKTTRLRSLSGEELIFANKDLLESRVKNFKRMWQRRVELKFNISYDTDTLKLQQVPKWIRGFIEEDGLLKFERSHLGSYQDNGFGLETVYWVSDPDFNKYMDAHQGLLFKIINKFRNEDIDFAIPTRQLRLEGQVIEDYVDDGFPEAGGHNGFDSRPS
jgi:Small-conductance mechanosensitive channel